MTNYIKTHTIAFVKEVDVENKHSIYLDLSNYKYNNYDTYLTYIFDNNHKVIRTFYKKLINRKIILEYENELKTIGYSSFYVVALPINNIFAIDFIKIEAQLLKLSSNYSVHRKIIAKVLLITHMMFPLFGMAFLSIAVTSYASLFGVPIDMIDISSQISILYNTVGQLLVVLLDLLLGHMYIVLFLILLFLLNPFYHLIYKRKLYKIFIKAPSFFTKLFDEKTAISSDITFVHLSWIYLSCIFIIIVTLMADIKNIERLSLDNKKTINKLGTELIHKGNSIIFTSLVKYNELASMPQYLKTKDENYIVVKAVQDDLVYFYTFDDLFLNIKSNENNSSVYERLCNMPKERNTLVKDYDFLNKKSIYKYDLSIGLSRPKSNIAPTSILVGSENAVDAFYERVDEYKKQLCNKQ